VLCLPGDDLVVLEDKLDYFGIVKGRVFALHSPGQEVVPAGQDRAREVQLAQDGVVKEKEADLVSLALVGPGHLQGQGLLEQIYLFRRWRGTVAMTQGCLLPWE